MVISTNSIGIKLVLIPPGEFLMGSPESEKDRRTNEYQHRVRITKPFYLGVYPVTQQEYEDVMGENPSEFTGDKRRPVENVFWLDAVRFFNRLSERAGREPYYRIDGENVTVEGGDGYRLPTEAEWEYACRAGTTSRWSCGDEEDDLDRVAWYAANADGTTHPVGEKEPNAWGLFDMHGNVLEWCWDWYDEDYYNSSPVSDPQGPSEASFRVFRGGCWWFDAWRCRAAFRRRFVPAGRHIFLGFRVAAVPPGKSSQEQTSQPAEPGAEAEAS
jgi:formylglycine-generating enzyme required for sulfatase activity